MNGYLYVNDSLELARRGEETSLEDAQVAVTGYAEAARLKQEDVATAQARTATLMQRRASWREQLEQARRDLESFLKAAINE